MRDNQEQIKEALTAVLDGTPIRQAARQFGVPKSTLFNRLKNPKLGLTLGADVPVRRGREKFLQLDEEQVVVDWANNMTEVGLAPSAAQVLLALQLFLNRQGRHSGFKDNLPSEGWFRRFRARHNLEVRKIESVSTPQTLPTEQSLRQWFNQVFTYLHKNGQVEILADPTRIWTCMERGFPLKHSGNEVVCPSNVEDSYYEKRSSKRPTISLVSAVGANGGILRPFVCYPYNRMPSSIVETMPSGWNVANTDSGWMTADTFLKYLKEHFIVGLQAMDVKFPILLLVEGHESHVSFEISEFCSENGIVLFGLHLQSTRILQPGYTSIFRPLKEYWLREFQKWLHSHPNRTITRQNFSPSLGPAWSSLTSEAVRQAYAFCGLYPWDPERLDFSVCTSLEVETIVPNTKTGSPIIPLADDHPEHSTNGDAIIDSIPSASASTTSSLTSVLLSSALTSALKLAPKLAPKTPPKPAVTSQNRRSVVPSSIALAPPVQGGSLGHMTVGQLVISELETRIPAEQLHQFRQTKAKNVNWGGPVEWLKLYDMWKGLVDQYMPPSVAPSVPSGQRQRRPRANPIPPPHRPAKQPKALPNDNSFVEWELPVYVELRETDSADSTEKCKASNSSQLSM